jgi:hypothetical protein
VDRFEVAPLYLAWAALPFFALTRMQEGIARACNWINLALLPPYVVRSLLLVVLMAAGHAIGLGSDATFAMAAAALATIATAIAQCLMLDRRLSRQFKPGPKRYEILKWFSTAIPIFMVEGFYLLLTVTDVLMLHQFRPPDEVGIYYAAAKTLALVAFVYFSVSAATAPRFSEYHVAGDRDRLAAFLANTIQWTFWPSLIATAVILVLGHDVLRLFGPHFVNGDPLLYILAVGLRQRRPAPVHSRRGPAGARRGRPRGAPAQHCWRPTRLRARLCDGVRGQRRGLCGLNSLPGHQGRRHCDRHRDDDRIGAADCGHAPPPRPPRLHLGRPHKGRAGAGTGVPMGVRAVDAGAAGPEARGAVTGGSSPKPRLAATEADELTREWRPLASLEPERQA